MTASARGRQKWTLGSGLAILCSSLFLVGALGSPVVGVFWAVVYFAIAMAMRRGQAWASWSAAGCLLLPVIRIVATTHGWTIGVAVSAGIQAVLAICFVIEGWYLRAQRSVWPAWPWVALLAAHAVEVICFGPYVMPSSSMRPTLLSGDSMLVNTISWKMGRVPRRGDIVVFRYPPDPQQVNIKRVMGLPGDHVRFAEKVVLLNGKPLSESYVIHTISVPDEYRDNFPRGVRSPGVREQAQDMLDRYVKDGELVVPPGNYFVLGDNRDSSFDSRYWGLLPGKNIFGTPVLIYDSHETPTLGEERQPAPTVLNERWGRLFRLL